jgi:uncharacterized protein DUF6081
LTEKQALKRKPQVDYAAILRHDSLWQPGSIKLADKTTWTYLEPNAHVGVKCKKLSIQVTPFTRRHDAIQTLDNSKHLYFSTKNYPEEIRGEVEYEVAMSARGIHTNEGEIYDGFAAFHLLDTDSGIAADFFAGNDSLAIAYSRPKATEVKARSAKDRKYLAVFKEIDVRTTTGQMHSYLIVYNPEQGRLSWKVDGELVAEEKNVPSRVKSFKLGLGVMTAKTITEGRSVSNHGQGLIGHWSPIGISEQENNL